MRTWPYTIALGVATGGVGAAIAIIKYRKSQGGSSIMGAFLGLPSF
jgi:hypothetical protein